MKKSYKNRATSPGVSSGTYAQLVSEPLVAPDTLSLLPYLYQLALRGQTSTVSQSLFRLLHWVYSLDFPSSSSSALSGYHPLRILLMFLELVPTVSYRMINTFRDRVLNFSKNKQLLQKLRS